MAESDLVALFAGIGLDETKAKETIKNAKLTSSLSEIIKEVSCA